MEEKILIVEDELIIAHSIKTALNQLGYINVYIAATGEEAVQTASDKSVDAVIMDIKLGKRIDGIEAAEIICSSREIPILYLTGYSDKTLCERAIHTKPSSYILKPYDINEIKINLDIALYKVKVDQKIKQAESALRESERKFSTILNSVHEVVWSYSLIDEELIYVSPSVEQLLGKTVKEFHQNKDLWVECVHPDYRSWVADRKNTEIVEMGLFEEDLRIKRKDGSIGWVHSRVKIVYDENGEPVRVDGLLTDITENIKAEERLRESRQKLIQAQHIAKVGDFTWDVETGEVVWSEALHSLLKYDIKDKIDYDKVNAEIHHPDDLERVTNWLNDCIASGRDTLTPNEYRLIKRDGEIIYVRTVGIIQRDGGNKTRVFATLQDITDRKKAEEAQIIRNKFEAMEIFSGYLAHDMNNLLSGLLGYMEIATDNLENAKETKVWLDKAMKVGEATADLIKRYMILTPSYSRKGKKQVAVSDILKQIVRNTVGKNIQSRYDISDKLWHVHADDEMIESVVNTVIENANEAMPEGGEFEVLAENTSIESKTGFLKSGDYVKLTFRDTGCGMSEETRKRVFDPYFSTKERGSVKGMGLSLALAYSMLKHNDGHIEIESKEGRGTAVIVWLPALREIQAPETVKEEVSAAAPASRRVLVLEDEETLREMIGEMLSRMGIEHELVSCGEDALEMYFKAKNEGDPFGLLLLDLTVKGGMGGVQTLKIIRGNDPEVRAAVMSGYSNDPVITKHIEYGFFAALPKPFTLKEFKAVIEAGKISC